MHRSFNNISIDLNGKIVLVTGGTGFFGRAFAKYVVKRFELRKLIIFSRDEMKQYEMAQELSPEKYDFMRYFIGDVRDRDRLVTAMRGVDYVVHAAALKHVPAAEYNPFECIRTNVIGAENIVNAAIEAGVKRVIALSTDKAANPVNLYGASKLASDKIFTAAGNWSGDSGTLFAVARYGNVLGSRGSVIPFFRKLIREGAESLPITDPRMTRFWITIEQSVAFVLSCLEMMGGSEIFVPKIPSMKMTNLASCLAPELPHRQIGIRPGEKLHEVMVTEDDSRLTYDLGDRYVIGPPFDWGGKKRVLDTGGKLVEEGFRYASDTNTEWLGEAELRKLLDEAEDA